MTPADHLAAKKMKQSPASSTAARAGENARSLSRLERSSGFSTTSTSTPSNPKEPTTFPNDVVAKAKLYALLGNAIHNGRCKWCGCYHEDSDHEGCEEEESEDEGRLGLTSRDSIELIMKSAVTWESRKVRSGRNRKSWMKVVGNWLRRYLCVF